MTVATSTMSHALRLGMVELARVDAEKAWNETHRSFRSPIPVGDMLPLKTGT